MALTDWDAFIAALNDPRDRLYLAKLLNPTTNARLASGWQTGPLPASTASTAVVPTKATAGSYPFDSWQNSGGALATYCVGGDIGGNDVNAVTHASHLLLVYDRLSHQGGLVGNLNTPQTTNLPTAALTRYTSGVGVMIGIEINSQVGTTGTTITVSYTNSGATSGRTTPAVVFGGTGFREGTRFIQLPLQVGDVGVQSVESVTLTASTGTAGNFGVVLYLPIFAVASIPGLGPVDPVISGRMFGGLPEIVDDACLFVIGQPGDAATKILTGSLSFAEA